MQCVAHVVLTMSFQQGLDDKIEAVFIEPHTDGAPTTIKAVRPPLHVDCLHLLGTVQPA